MNRLALAIAVAALAASGATAKSDKRGVSENQFSMGSMLESLEPGVTWYYNWGNTPSKGYENQVIDFKGIEFVPMCWNANYNADAIREYCKSHPATKYLLGFNEPNFTNQANMTPQQAAEAWPAVKALADELGLKLVGPALNYSPNPPYNDPVKWMDEFVALVGIDAFDYTAVHSYGGLGNIQDIAGRFHDKYGKDVWVTEFCYWPGESQSTYVAPATQIDNMTRSLEWLETTPWIFRYAWFKPMGKSDSTSGPNYGLLVQDGTGLDPWVLSEQGKVYVGMTVFDESVWHPVGETVAASEYIRSELSGLGSTKDAACPSIVEISHFNGGAKVVWQFDVPEAADYYITLGVTGYGEPTRFDPQLQWMLVDGEQTSALSEVLKPSLPNNETDYVKVQTLVSLPAGHVQLMLQDVAPYQTSGIRLSTIRLDNSAGVGDILGDILGDSTEDGQAVYYTLQGVRVDNPSRGIYLRLHNGRTTKVVR